MGSIVLATPEHQMFEKVSVPAFTRFDLISRTGLNDDIKSNQIRIVSRNSNHTQTVLQVVYILIIWDQLALLLRRSLNKVSHPELSCLILAVRLSRKLASDSLNVFR